MKRVPGLSALRLTGWLVCMTLAAASTAHAGVFCDNLKVSPLEQSLHRTVVRLEWDRLDADPVASAHTLTVAVPTADGARLRVLNSVARPVDPRLVGDRSPANDVAQIGPAHKYRSQWLVSVRVDPVTASLEHLTSITLELTHPSPHPPRAGKAKVDPDAHRFGSWLTNPAAASEMRQAELGRPKHVLDLGLDVVDTFGHSPNWVRVEVVETGLYEVYDDLQRIVGDDADAVVPGSLRLFSANVPYQPIGAGDKKGSWKRDYELFERPLLVEAASSVLQAGDRVIFFAPGHETWSDHFDPVAGPLDHFEHEFADRLAYWITYNLVGETPGDFGAAPLRMSSLDVTPQASADQVRTEYRERVQLEENLVQAYGVTPDNWGWLQTIAEGAPVTFSLIITDVVTTASGTLSVPAFARPAPGDSINDVAVMEVRSGTQGLGLLSWRLTEQEGGRPDLPLRLEIANLPVQEGENLITIANESPANSIGRHRELLFDSMSATFRRQLITRDGALPWGVYEDEVNVDGTWEFNLTSDNGNWNDPILVDVTYPLATRVLTGAELNGSTLRLQVPMTEDQRRHFIAANAGGLMSPAGLRAHRPRTIRAKVSDEQAGIGYDLVVLAPSEFMSAAEDLAAFRAQTLGRATAVDLQDVYDQFGFGVKEPAAIRNYLKFLNQVDPRLDFAVLLGDASRDYRNRSERDLSGPEIDRCPTFIQTQYPYRPTSSTRKPYAADDWFGCFDDPPTQVGSSIFIDLPDIAVGRLPAGNLTEARRLVDRIIQYETNPASGPWRNEVLLVADDEVGLSGPNYGEVAHITEAECMAEALLPSGLDIDKLYLTDFDVVPGTRAKPTARQAMGDRWSNGKLIVHYIGHGSPEQMADEAVFRIEDVPGLTNGEQLPLMLAFSCDVAIFDSHTSKSMSEQLVLTPGGGAIGTIAATQVTFIGPNEELTETFYPSLYLDDELGRSQPIGQALVTAKLTVPRLNFSFTQHNGQRYVLLGDPSLRLHSPTESVELSGDLTASIRSGQPLEITGSVPELRDQLADGTYYLEVQEASDSTFYYVEAINRDLEYRNDGSAFFHGSGSFEAGEANVDLIAPSFMKFGDEGRVQLILESGSEAYVGVVEPSVVRGPIQGDDVDGPQIQLAFASDARIVTPGAVLTARLNDPSGVNVLGTVPANSIRLEFDDSGIAVDVTSLFQLESGSFQAGSLQYVLPDEISVGTHTVVLTASDMLNNLSQVALDFEVQPAGGVTIANHAVFPNPFEDSTRFVVEVTAPPEVGSELAITVYTTSGRPLRRLTAISDGSTRQVIDWDGKDDLGDDIANGVYLYTVRATFGMTVPVTLTDAGRVVRMR